jgi:hypothetical protein
VTVAGETSIDHAAVHAAIARGREVLWRTQRPDGSWESLCDMGAIPTAQVLVALASAGCLTPDDAADGAQWLRTRQEPDGSYRSHPTAAEGDLGATASAWAALSLCATEEGAEAISRAREWVDEHGGSAAVVDAFGRGDPAVVYVALAGLIDPSELPCPPMLPALIRPAVRFMERRFHSGILMVSGALTLIAHRLRGDWDPPALPPAPPPSPPDGPPSGQIAPLRRPHVDAARHLSESRRQLERQHGPDRADPPRTARRRSRRRPPDGRGRCGLAREPARARRQRPAL